MQTQLVKWGNSVAVRLPKPMLDQTRLAAGDSVELEAQGSGAILVRARRRLPDIEELCARITPENRHAETFTGAAMGNEVW